MPRPHCVRMPTRSDGPTIDSSWERLTPPAIAESMSCSPTMHAFATTSHGSTARSRSFQERLSTQDAADHEWDTGMTTVVFVVVTAVAVALIVVPLVMGARKRQSLPPTKQQYPDPNPSDHDSRDDADG